MTDAQLLEAQTMWDEGFNTFDIAEELGLDQATVANALAADRDALYPL